MAGRRLKRLIPGHFADLCESKNIKTVQDLIERPDLDIIDALDISVGDLASALRKVYATLAPKPRTAFNMLDAEMSSLTFESSKVRIEPGIITEVVGAAGVGKSQWCTTLSAMAYLPIEYGGLGGGVIYVDTESSFSPSRLVEIARSRYPKFYDVKALKKLTQSIHVFQCSHAHELVDQITQLDATIIEKQIKMIIVDSMASPFRSDFDSKHIPERQMMLSIAASKLKYLGETYRIPIVVTNQVSGGMKKGLADDGENLTAALGITWAHAVNVRYRLQNKPGKESMECLVSKSPCSARLSFQYSIANAGLIFNEK